MEMNWVLFWYKYITFKLIITNLNSIILFDDPMDIQKYMLEAHPMSMKLKYDKGNIPLQIASKMFFIYVKLAWSWWYHDSIKL